MQKIFLLALFLQALAAPFSAYAGPASDAVPPAPADAIKIHYLHAEGVINPVMAEFLIGGIKDAREEGAAAVIIQLDTPEALICP